ncbi:MAG: TolC family protein [Bacteroidales bacterium]
MNYKRFILQGGCLAILSCLPSMVWAQNNETIVKLSLEQALEIALTESPTIEIADKQIEIKRFAKKEKIGALLPNISGTAQYSRTLKKQKFIFGGGGMPGMGDGDSAGESESSQPMAVEVGTSNSWSGGFNISLPLVAPTLWKNVQLGTIDIEKAVEASRQSNLDMAKQVQDAYYNILLSEDSYDVILKSYKQAQANADITRERLKQGVVSEYDLIRSEVQVKNMEPNLLQAESGVALSKLKLKTLLGLSDVELQVEGSLNDYRKDMYAETLNSDLGLQQNTTLRQLDLEVKSMKTMLKMQQFAYIPTLAANFNYTYNALSDDFKFRDYQWFPYSTIGFSLQIPIFEGGVKYFRNKQTKVGIQTLALQRIDLERNLNMQLKNAKDQINRTVRQVESTQGGVDMAQKGLTIARKRYETGMGTFIELNDAEIALLQSELQYNQAIYEYLSAKSALENILGTFNYTKYTEK